MTTGKYLFIELVTWNDRDRLDDLRMKMFLLKLIIIFQEYGGLEKALEMGTLVIVLMLIIEILNNSSP